MLDPEIPKMEQFIVRVSIATVPQENIPALIDHKQAHGQTKATVSINKARIYFAKSDRSLFLFIKPVQGSPLRQSEPAGVSCLEDTGLF